MTVKRTVYIRNACIVPAEIVWPGKCCAGDMVLRGELASAHPVLGEPDHPEASPIRTSLIVSMNLAARRIETKNTVYEVIA